MSQNRLLGKKILTSGVQYNTVIINNCRFCLFFLISHNGLKSLDSDKLSEVILTLFIMFLYTLNWKLWLLRHFWSHNVATTQIILDTTVISTLLTIIKHWNLISEENNCRFWIWRIIFSQLTVYCLHNPEIDVKYENYNMTLEHNFTDLCLLWEKLPKTWRSYCCMIIICISCISFSSLLAVDWDQRKWFAYNYNSNRI